MSSRDAHEALRSCLAACAITVAAELAFAGIDAHVLGPWPNTALDLAHVLVAAGGGLWLWTRRSAPNPRHCDLVFLLVGLTYLPVFWVGELTAARLGLVREPLIAHQILMVGVALLAPSSLLLGAGLILAITVDAVVLWEVLRSQYALPGVAGEPWMTLVFSGVSLSFLVARGRRRRLAEHLAHARAEAEAYASVNRLFLALRDRANSPLQTLELGVTLLERRTPDQAAVLASMRVAVQRLELLAATLVRAGERRETPGRGESAVDVAAPISQSGGG